MQTTSFIATSNPTIFWSSRFQKTSTQSARSYPISAQAVLRQRRWWWRNESALRRLWLRKHMAVKNTGKDAMSILLLWLFGQSSQRKYRIFFLPSFPSSFYWFFNFHFLYSFPLIFISFLKFCRVGKRECTFCESCRRRTTTTWRKLSFERLDSQMLGSGFSFSFFSSSFWENFHWDVLSWTRVITKRVYF